MLPTHSDSVVILMMEVHTNRQEESIMKTTFKFIIAAMAAVSVFSSCQKELANETVNNTTGGVRTIAVQFDNSTKATLDGFTPKFANGDAIRVSNTEKSEECTVSVDGSGNATFTTTLSGALTAIYPSAAAVLSSGEADAPIATSNNIKVPASQDGDVAKAIIAKAGIADGRTSATFNVQTALFQITPPDGVKTFTITSLKPVVNGVARTGEAVAINTDGATDAAKLVITVSNNDLTTFYVALKAGVNLSDLSFEYITDATNGLGAMKGIPAKDIAAAGKTDATAANTKYTIDNTNWHPYVEIEMAVQPGVGMPAEIKTYKWATMNIGANSETEAGKYFMYGETTGITPSGSSFSFPDSKYYSADNSSWAQAKGFAWENCPWTNGTYVFSSEYKVFNVFTKYVSQTSFLAEGFACDNKEILDLADDAANANWGGSWRMPNRWEFHGLTLKGWDYTNEGCKIGTSPNQIFLPLTGTGEGTDLKRAEDYCRYWSSSVSIDYPNGASHLYCNLAWDEDPDPFMGDDRYRGHPVRALSEK